MSAVESAARAAGRHLAGPPFRVPLDTAVACRLPAIDRAIYIALDVRGGVDYIGKVDRPDASAAASRLSEHFRKSQRKRAVWRWLWVVPLSAAATGSELEGLERSLIKTFRPPGNVQHARAA